MIHRTRRYLRRGVTLLELAISITIMGILIALVVPSFARVREQNQVDAATQFLRSIWCAQRVYWLENRTFTDSLSTLKSMGLIDVKVLDGGGGFSYSLSNVSADEFTATALRTGSTTWSGSMQIKEDGEVTGYVSGAGNAVLTPPEF